MRLPSKAGVFRDRDFALLFSGTTVNSIGDWLLELALPVYVFIETGSGLSTAGVYLVGLIVRALFGPLGGSLADRWPIRYTLSITNILQALALTPLLFASPQRLWPVYVVVLIQGAISSVNDPASFAVLPRIVDDDDLLQANSAMTAGGSVARLIGAAIGGVAVATGGLVLVVVLDAMTFLVGAVTAWLMSSSVDRAGHPEHDGAPPPDVDASVGAGLREVRARPVVAAVVWIQTLAMFVFGGFPILFIAFVTNYLDGGGTEVGLIRASSALGGILAAAVLGGISKRLNSATIMTVGYLLFGVVSFAFINAPSITTVLWVYLILFSLTGFPNVASQVGARSTAQTLCPPEVMGRLGGLMTATSAVGMGAGAVAAGVLVETFTSRFLLNGQAAIFLVCGLAAAIFVARPTLPSPAS